VFIYSNFAKTWLSNEFLKTKPNSKWWHHFWNTSVSNLEGLKLWKLLTCLHCVSGFIESQRRLGSTTPSPVAFMVLAHLLYGNACAKGRWSLESTGMYGMCVILKDKNGIRYVDDVDVFPIYLLNMVWFCVTLHCNLCLLEVSKASMPEFCLGRCRIRVWVRPSRFQCCSSQMSKPHGQESISFPTLGIWPPRSLAGCLLTQTESLFTQCVKLGFPLHIPTPHLGRKWHTRAHGLGATRLCWWNLAGVPLLYCYQCLVPWDQATKLDLNEEATDRTNSGLVPRMATKVFHTLGCAETRLQIGPHLN